jgi:adenine-specific DNA-methyltransferase
MKTLQQSSYKLPGSGPEREALREKGQFWTPDWIAEAMVGYVIADSSDHIFDPAVGAGAFFHAAKSLATTLHRRIELLGTELDPEALRQAQQSGLSSDDLAKVQIKDFVLNPPRDSFKAIVANPPYIRHHRLSSEVKSKLRALGEKIVGASLDGRAGLHIYFLLRALQLLARGGRLAFIMPADTCEGIFAQTLWRWITRNYRLDGVVTFEYQASPFPKVDTNPIIFLIRNDKPVETFSWVRCTQPNTEQLKAWTLSGFEICGKALDIQRREISEGLETGLSRPLLSEQSNGYVLGDFAKVMRGIATGANDFFFVTSEQAGALGIPDDFLINAIGRTRDVTGDVINAENLRALDADGKPTLLFSPDGRPIDHFPKAVQEYLRKGERAGIHKKTLIATRRPWYKMEVRPAPPFLFAYLGRRNARFIRNAAKVVPLTGFLCVYPRRNDPAFTSKLWKVLQHPETVANLSLVGKSYGGGAIKVEPRSLERLPLPSSVLSEVRLGGSVGQLKLHFNQ